MKKFNILLITAFVLLTSGLAIGQTEIIISGDDLNTCDGYLRDDNNQGDYAANTDETITICPEAPETILNLYWTGFTVGTGDNITIYDGPDSSYPQVDGSPFNGTSLLLTDVTSTNPSGCLTIHFTSDGDDSVGDFGAIVTCGLPCAKPVAIVSVGDENVAEHILVCKDEELTFDASASTFQNDASYQSVTWDFGDGTTNTTSWPTVSKTYPTAGAYKVNMFVTDNNGCQSINTINIVIKVATDPEITVSADDYLVCAGQEFTLFGTAEPTPWTSNPQIDFGGALFLPDQQGLCFSDTLWVSNFDQSQTITSLDDLLGLGVNMEHSYMGDLIITFFCPDGSSIVVHNQGGSSTWLGTPCDQDTNPNQAGRPSYYTWTPTSTNPIWSQGSGAGLTTPAEDPCTGSGNSLNPGDYSAVGDWNALIGCPLNGAWVVNVCDQLASDNGFIFGWNVQFNPALYGEDLSFTPSIGMDCDSTFWAGPFVTDNSANCDTLNVVPSAAGNYTYTYTALDNHGCTYTETVNVQVYEGPVADAGEDFYFCGPQTPMIGTVSNPQPNIQYVYSWNNPGYLTNSNVASTNILAYAFTSDTTEFVLSIYPTDDQNCLVHDTVLAIVPEYPPFAVLDTIDICVGEAGILFAPTPDPSDYTYLWTYSVDNVELDTLPDTYRSLDINVGGYYTVNVYEPGCQFMSPTPYRVFVVPCDIRYPNIFTPNGDGENDMFEIYGMQEYPGSTLVVYNRWGQVVYESKDYRNTWNGGELAEGVYYYIAEIKKATGVEPFAGYFQLVRK